jgi:hypothetical protein
VAAPVRDASVAVAVIDAAVSDALAVESVARMARLEVTLNPWGTVIVNGQRKESTATYTLAPGRYRVIGELRDHRAARTVTLRPGESRHVRINLL